MATFANLQIGPRIFFRHARMLSGCHPVVLVLPFVGWATSGVSSLTSTNFGLFKLFELIKKQDVFYSLRFLQVLKLAINLDFAYNYRWFISDEDLFQVEVCQFWQLISEIRILAHSRGRSIRLTSGPKRIAYFFVEAGFCCAWQTLFDVLCFQSAQLEGKSPFLP